MVIKPEVIEERLRWTIKIGWGAIGVFVWAFVWLLTFYIPQQIASTQTAIKADTSAQLEPLKIQLATINALLQLKETKNVSEAIRLGVNFSEPKYAFAAVKAIAQQAQIENIETPSSVLVSVNDSIQKTAQSDPAFIQDAWSAQLALVNYRSSFVPGASVPPSSSQPLFQFHGPSVSSIVLSGGHQRLDGRYWRNVIFSNTQIEYDGGTLALENVRFVDCTFTMGYNTHANKLAGMLLAQATVTGSFG